LSREVDLWKGGNKKKNRERRRKVLFGFENAKTGEDEDWTYSHRNAQGT